jgi:DNA-binding transcriptional ArsR family regulator
MSQHFKILREAGLIRSERKGVELKNSTRCQGAGRRSGNSHLRNEGYAEVQVRSDPRFVQRLAAPVDQMAHR